MSRRIVLIPLLATTTVLVTACTSPQVATIDPDFGAAVSHNIAVQTIDPAAGLPDDSASGDGQKVWQAIEAYRGESAEIITESLIQDVGGN